MSTESDQEAEPLPHRITRSQRLLDVVDAFSRVVLVSHINPDPDALAAMLGLKALFAHERPELEVVMTYDGLIARAENQLMVDLIPIPVVPVQSVRFDQDSAIIMVDSQPRTGRHTSRIEAATIVIDHHETGGDLSGVIFRDIRATLGATCTIISGYLIERQVPISRSLATALLYGIESEISGYPREAGPLDDGALVWLFPQADKDLLARIRNPKLPRSHFDTFEEALRNAELFDDVVVAWCGEVNQPDIIAELADFFVRFDQVEWALTGGLFDHMIKLSIRSNPLGFHAGERLRSAVDHLGTAGGHDKRAGGAIPLKDLNPDNVAELFREVYQRLLRDYRATVPKPQRLIDQGRAAKDRK